MRLRRSCRNGLSLWGTVSCWARLTSLSTKASSRRDILAHQLQMTHCEPGAANGMLYVLLPKYRQLYEGCEGVLTLVRVIERHVYDDGHQAPTGFDHFRCEFLSPGGLIELPMSYVKQAYCQNGNMGMMDDELQT